MCQLLPNVKGRQSPEHMCLARAACRRCRQLIVFGRRANRVPTGPMERPFLRSALQRNAYMCCCTYVRDGGGLPAALTDRAVWNAPAAATHQR